MQTIEGERKKPPEAEIDADQSADNCEWRCHQTVARKRKTSEISIGIVVSEGIFVVNEEIVAVTDLLGEFTTS